MRTSDCWWHCLVNSAPTDSCSGQSTVADILTASTAWSTPERSHKSRSDSFIRLREASQKRAAAKITGLPEDEGPLPLKVAEATCEEQNIFTAEGPAPEPELAPAQESGVDEGDEETEDDYFDARSDASFHTAPGSVRSNSPQTFAFRNDLKSSDPDDHHGNGLHDERQRLGPHQHTSSVGTPLVEATDIEETWTEDTSITTQSQSPSQPHTQSGQWRLDSNVDIAEQIILGEAAYEASKLSTDQLMEEEQQPAASPSLGSEAVTTAAQHGKATSQKASAAGRPPKTVQPTSSPCDHAGWAFLYEAFDTCSNCKRSQRFVAVHFIALT